MTISRRSPMRALPSARGAAPLLAAAAAGVIGAPAAALLGRPPGGVVVTALFLAALAALSTVDLRERRIPNAYTYGGTALALLAAGFGGVEAVALSVLGLLIGGGAMGALYLLGRGQLGFGDVKLAAFAGAVLGAEGTPAFLLAGTVLGAVAAAALMAMGRDRRSTFAYGPYLAAGAALVVVVRGPLLA